MATIDDLPIADFSKMSDEELLARIKDVRQRRRSPSEEVRQATKKKAVAKQKRGKAIALQDISKFAKDLTPEQAKELLKKLKGE